MTVTAPAKINLYLEVLGRRPDGFHELVTVLQTIDLCDSLTLALRERHPDLAPGRSDVDLVLADDDAAAASVPSGADNLAVRAAAAVLTAAGECDATGVSIRLTKSIPAGGGLGGGSSDAAAAARATNALLGWPCDHARLSQLCAGLGSDVPFFLTGGTALCTGRGELIRPLAPPAPFAATLALPGFGVPTPAVYQALAAAPAATTRHASNDSGGTEPGALADAVAGASLQDLERIYRNDLEEPACRVAPELTELLREPRFHLSGSGSTLFAYGASAEALLAGLAWRSIRFVTVHSKNR